MSDEMRWSWAVVARGASVRDKLLIAFYCVARFRPRAWQLLARMAGARDWGIRLAASGGPARVVFNPLSTAELTVVDELLFGELYTLGERFDTLVDCGAFRGISTIYLQDQAKAARVVAFEPQADNFRVLSRRLARHLPEACCINAAVGVESGEVFFEGDGVGGKVSLAGDSVKQVSLSDAPELASAGRLLLKMDIEGAEEQVLPKLLAALPQTCTILLETHFEEAKTAELVLPYETAGFRARVLRKRKDPDSSVWFMDWELER